LDSYYQRNKEKYKKYRQREDVKKRNKIAVEKYRKTTNGLINVMLSNIRSRSRRSKIPCDIDKKWIEKRLSDGCELTGLSFDCTPLKKQMNMFSPSIDKIDPKKGYIKENCRLILFGLNAFKCTNTDDEMIFVAKRLIEGVC
jgi:hypothetical protein